MKWVTWQNVGVDRIGCAWLIRKFIDPSAEFLFVPEAKVLQHYGCVETGFAATMFTYFGNYWFTGLHGFVGPGGQGGA